MHWKKYREDAGSPTPFAWRIIPVLKCLVNKHIVRPQELGQRGTPFLADIYDGSKWVFPKIVVPQNGGFIMENPIKMNDFGGTPIFGNTQMGVIQSPLLEWDRGPSSRRGLGGFAWNLAPRGWCRWRWRWGQAQDTCLGVYKTQGGGCWFAGWWGVVGGLQNHHHELKFGTHTHTYLRGGVPKGMVGRLHCPWGPCNEYTLGETTRLYTCSCVIHENSWVGVAFGVIASIQTWSHTQTSQTLSVRSVPPSYIDI